MDIPDINQVFEWIDLEDEAIRVERVLHILPEGKAWMVIHLPKKKEQKRSGPGKRRFPFERSLDEYANAFAAGTLRTALKDPFEDVNVPGSDGEESKHRKRLQKNWLLIKPVVDNPLSLFSDTRGPLIAAAAKAAGRQKSEVYDYCIRYWQRGQVAGSIAPLYARINGECEEVKKAGRKRGPRGKIVNGEASPHTHIAIGPEEREKLLKGIKRFRLREKRPLEKAYERTIREYWSEKVDSLDGLKLRRPLPTERSPTYRQFLHVWYKYRAKNFAKVGRKLLGERKFTLTERVLSNSHTRKADRPGQRFEIDAHIADCELVHSVTRLPIDRPTVYFVVDVFSHVIVGVAITLEPPSYIGAALALINAFTDKVEYCKQFGVIIEPEHWPCHHLCKVVVADRGELLSNIADVLGTAFGVEKDILPSYRPDMKPLVERFFKRLNEKRRFRLPGAVLGPKQRGERDPKLDAKLDVPQYTEIVIRTILELNSEWTDNYPLEKSMVANGINPVPLDIWKWGIKNRSGVLRQKTKEFVRANLLPRGKASVTRSGIEFARLEYLLPPDLGENWQLASSDADAEVEIAYDPRLVDAIHLCDQQGIAGKYGVCKLKDKHDAHLGCSWREFQLWSESQAYKRKKAYEPEKSKRMENDIRIDGTLRVAEAKRKAAIHPSLSKSAFLKGSSENREDARRSERQATPLIKNPSPKATDVNRAPAAKEDIAPDKIVLFPEKSRSAQEADLLRLLRDEG